MDILFIDDEVDTSNAKSQEEIDRAFEQYLELVKTRKEPDKFSVCSMDITLTDED